MKGLFLLNEFQDVQFAVTFSPSLSKATTASGKKGGTLAVDAEESSTSSDDETKQDGGTGLAEKVAHFENPIKKELLPKNRVESP